MSDNSYSVNIGTWKVFFSVQTPDKTKLSACHINNSDGIFGCMHCLFVNVGSLISLFWRKSKYKSQVTRAGFLAGSDKNLLPG